MPGIDDVWSGDEELQKEDEPNDALHELAAFMGDVAHGPSEAPAATAEPPPKLNNESASSSSCGSNNLPRLR